MAVNNRAKKIIYPNAFTYIELLVVVGVFLVVAAFGVPVFADWQGALALDTAGTEALSLLRTARARAVSGLGDSRHGVYFDTAAEAPRLVLFRGSSFSGRDPGYDQEVVLGRVIEINAGDLNSEAVFSRAPAAASATGTLIINRTDSDDSISINIDDYGIIR